MSPGTAWLTACWIDWFGPTTRTRELDALAAVTPKKFTAAKAANCRRHRKDTPTCPHSPRSPLSDNKLP